MKNSYLYSNSLVIHRSKKWRTGLLLSFKRRISGLLILIFHFIMSTPKKICIKKYELGSDIMVAVCDTELIGKSFENNELVLKVTESFYKGEEATENEVVRSLKHATIANLVGERAVKCALDNGFIEENGVIFVAGVPHAQIVKM